MPTCWHARSGPPQATINFLDIVADGGIKELDSPIWNLERNDSDVWWWILLWLRWTRLRRARLRRLWWAGFRRRLGRKGLGAWRVRRTRARARPRRPGRSPFSQACRVRDRGDAARRAGRRRAGRAAGVRRDRRRI